MPHGTHTFSRKPFPSPLQVFLSEVFFIRLTYNALLVLCDSGMLAVSMTTRIMFQNPCNEANLSVMTMLPIVGLVTKRVNADMSVAGEKFYGGNYVGPLRALTAVVSASLNRCR